MFDIWGFLLQTLNVSGAAAVILLMKAMFHDKLPPKWQFAVWGVLGIILLVPAGFQGRYALYSWAFPVEVIKSWFGDYSYTQVLLPIPVLKANWQTIGEWIFAGYVAGVLVSLLKYVVAYLGLRLVLRSGEEPDADVVARIEICAKEQNVKLGKVIAIPELTSAFVCGIFRPVLVLPMDKDLDDKIILHELQHLKYKDTVWTMVICFWKSIHWCNLFLVYCANRALNDLEARCDQYVLELLEGEQRRDYGRILLDMANERYAKTPGCTCINNGGKHIRKRIEAIARFKKYPVGMRLVSICVIVLLALFLTVGVQATELREYDTSVDLSMAAARSTPCTTLAGALDTYGKAVLEYNGYYRAMCAPQFMQQDLLAEIKEKEGKTYPTWDSGIACWPDKNSGYHIYNLRKVEKDVYEAVLIVKTNYPPDGMPESDNMFWMAYQNVRAQKENGRWVVWDLEKFQYVESNLGYFSLDFGCPELPGLLYADTVGDICVEVRHQTVHKVDNTSDGTNQNWMLGSASCFDTTARPNAEFSTEYYNYEYYCTHLGTQEERDEITRMGVHIAPVFEGEERPVFKESVAAPWEYTTGSDGTSSCGRSLEPGWGPTVSIGGGGSSWGAGIKITELPESYAVDLYLNGRFASEMDLHLQEEVKTNDK